ncbi:hypothetical protein HBHAL_4624 [Halobacillus halophilus DSM 2266]|uniref:Uncharacterized protein n=1 Tax=Halobacillus halophilus (strain ATCC 35676 / DSM 2266 / JCM 20832 / KCTC 3685 / LMG 17431 / NBRC 102448 / NCIMB 2269) TaxID=866895 RepID=I0JS41_HALH3|nr:hypothetical protein HBHAL_4624 [Halobacillus halophilus DSM 2266]
MSAYPYGWMLHHFEQEQANCLYGLPVFLSKMTEIEGERTIFRNEPKQDG